MSAARTERLLNLLTLLLNARRPFSLREIRDLPEFAAYQTEDPKSGERAFERDKAALLELGVPLRWVPPEQDDDEEGLGGYAIDRDKYYLPDLHLAPAELALLSIAGAAAAAIDGFPGRAAVIRALGKLGFDIDEARPRPALAHAPALGGIDPARLGLNLDVLHEAVARRRRVRLVYRAARGERSAREVDPYGLYYRRGVWYLVGQCHLRRAERTFHLGRIEEARFAGAEEGGPDFEVPASFDLSQHVHKRPWEFPHERPIEVVIRLAERLVPAIHEIFGHGARVERTGAAVDVHLTVTHSDALIAAVLPYGGAAQVVAPPELRAKIADIYARLAGRYARRPKRAGAASARGAP